MDRPQPQYSIPGGLALLAGLAWLAFGFFGVHLLFVDDEVSEPPPVFAATPTQPVQPVDHRCDDLVDLARPGPPNHYDSTDISTTDHCSCHDDPGRTGYGGATIVTEYSGTFVGRDHPTSGNALVLGDGSGQRFLRFEEFETDNGPDLNVYLVNSSAGGVDDFIDLGDLKGNIGDQNYEVPADADLAVYDTVLIWCVRFSSPFGEATLATA